MADASAPDSGVAPVTISWEPCTAARGTREAECADVEVPIDWSDPSGGTTTVFVKRVTRPGSRGQLWLLHGGPGGTGRLFESGFDLLDTVVPDLDYYTLDHRGSGASGPLDCRELAPPAGGYSQLTRESVTACADRLTRDHPDELRATRMTAAAEDLAALIEAVREPSDRVVVYGVSGGTAWAHRYLQLHPEQADAAVLDSICHTCGDWLAYERDHDRLGRALLAECAADTLCASKLGPDPEAFLEALVRPAAPVCPAGLAGLGTTSVRVAAGNGIENGFASRYLPAILYRLARCSPQDVAALSTLWANLFAGSSSAFAGSSMAAFLHISTSDLTPSPPLAEVEAFEATSLFSKELDYLVAIAAPVWPAGAPDPLAGSFAETSIPLLMMNGTLDAQTSIEGARAFAAEMAGPHHYFVELPRTRHVALTSSATVADLVNTRPCGAQILASFLASPESPPDTSCTVDILPLGFSWGATIDEAMWGTTDIWGDGP